MSNSDPWTMITVDTSKFPKRLQDAFFLFMDGGTGTAGGKCEMELGTFLDILEQNAIITTH